MSEPDARLFFMHVPRTAGTTLVDILEQQFDEADIARWLYPVRLAAQPPAFFEQHRYFHGHVDYSAISGCLRGPRMVMTFMRDPVERYLSHFGNHKRVLRSNIPERRREAFDRFQQTSLEQFVRHPPEVLAEEAARWLNRQARMLTSETDPAFESARARLDELAFVGLTERLQDSLFLLAYTFGWMPAVDPQRMNQSPPGGRPHAHELPADLLDEIRALNGVDVELYQYGVQVFERRFQQMCEELVERHGRAEHTHAGSRPSNDVLVDLLDAHYRHRFLRRHRPQASIRVDFERALSGRNWHARERFPDGTTYRWTGPGPSAIVDLPVAASSDLCLRFAVVGTMTGDVPGSLVTTINGEPLETRTQRLEGGAAIVEARVPRGVLARRPGLVRVGFEVERTIRPIDVMEGSRDDRPLGVAVSWIALEPCH